MRSTRSSTARDSSGTAAATFRLATEQQMAKQPLITAAPGPQTMNRRTFECRAAWVASKGPDELADCTGMGLQSRIACFQGCALGVVYSCSSGEELCLRRHPTQSACVERQVQRL